MDLKYFIISKKEEMEKKDNQKRKIALEIQVEETGFLVPGRSRTPGGTTNLQCDLNWHLLLLSPLSSPLP